jgi:hypothetical protein
MCTKSIQQQWIDFTIMNLSIERNDQELAILHEKREINQ